jgi:hypothetical protein
VVKKVRYPADRLARRIKIWYCSSGFSLSTESSIQQFVSELRLTGDSTLESFADEQFDHILDWANLLEVLRKYEQRLMLEAPPASHGDRTDEVVSFSVEASLVVRGGQQTQPVQPVVFELGETFSVESIAEQVRSTLSQILIALSYFSPQLSSHFGVSRSEMAAQLPGLLTREGDNPLTKGLGLLKDDLTFAEDLILVRTHLLAVPSHSPSLTLSIFPSISAVPGGGDRPPVGQLHGAQDTRHAARRGHQSAVLAGRRAQGRAESTRRRGGVLLIRWGRRKAETRVVTTQTDAISGGERLLCH